MYYGDSISHLVRARELVDSINPGLFEQLGNVWLPLPHLLLLPFTLIDPLFRTGFAGTALSLPCLAITSVFFYKIIKSQLNVWYIAIVGALLYATNPNVLYLGITPMTEAPFMLFFVGGAYYFLKWTSRSLNNSSYSSHVSCNSRGFTAIDPKQIGDSTSAKSSCVYINLVICSIFISLATLCRYEGWVLPLFLVTFVVVSLIRKQNRIHDRNYKIGTILVSALSFTGIALWLIWNAYTYNDPLEFANATHFSATQAMAGPNRATLILQPWNVIPLYGLSAYAIYGPIILSTAFCGYLFHKYMVSNGEGKKRRNLYLFLVMPPIFTIASLLAGVGEMNQGSWFNSRFLILVAPLVVFIGLHFHICVFQHNQVELYSFHGDNFSFIFLPT